MAHTPFKLDPVTLHGLGVFAGLESSAYDDILNHVKVRYLPKGLQIFRQGEACDTCHALIDGRVKIQQAGSDGQRVVVRYVGPREMFGILAMFLPGGYPGDAIAVNDSVAIVWSADSMRGLMMRYPAIAMNALANLGHRLSDLQLRMRELSTQRVERRIANALIRLMHQAGRTVAGGVEIDFPISRQNVAEMTGTTLHTVSRILSAWEGQGVIESGRQHVLIRQPHQLMAIADDLPSSMELPAQG